MSGYKKLLTNAPPISIVNTKCEKATLEGQNRNSKIPLKVNQPNGARAHNQLNLRIVHKIGQRPSRIPILTGLQKVRTDRSQNPLPKSSHAEGIQKTKFAVECKEKRLVNRFNCRQQKQNNLNENAFEKSTTKTKTYTYKFPESKWNKLLKLNEETYKIYKLNSPMSREEENMLLEADYYCRPSTSSLDLENTDAGRQKDSPNSSQEIPQQEEAIAEAPEVLEKMNNNIDHQIESNLVFNNLRMAAFCIGLAITLPTLYLAYIWNINSVPENVEVPRTLAQTYFFDYINFLFK